MRSPATLPTLLLLLALGNPALSAQKAMGPKAAPRTLAPHASQGGSRTATPGSRTPKGFTAVPRPLGTPAPPSSLVLRPRALPRFAGQPSRHDWESRDILAEVQAMSRRGFIPVIPAKDAPELTGSSLFPAGWSAYGFVVPPGKKLHVRLHHPNQGWFRLALVDRWGRLGPGMLQNLIPTGNPEVSYTNPSENATAVYVIVDDPTWMATQALPFTLKVDRDWTPGAGVPALPRVFGVWAEAKASKEAQPAESRPSESRPSESKPPAAKETPTT